MYLRVHTESGVEQYNMLVRYDDSRVLDRPSENRSHCAHANIVTIQRGSEHAETGSPPDVDEGRRSVLPGLCWWSGRTARAAAL